MAFNLKTVREICREYEANLEISRNPKGIGRLLWPHLAKKGLTEAMGKSENSLTKTIGEATDMNQEVADRVNAIIKERNSDIRKSLCEYGMDVDEFLHPITGEPYLLRKDLERIDSENVPESVRAYFHEKRNLGNRNKGIISGRGPNYYFQFPGLRLEGNPLANKDLRVVLEDGNGGDADYAGYCDEIGKHLAAVRKAKEDWIKELGTESGEPAHTELGASYGVVYGAHPEDFEKWQKRGLLVLMDHEKNVLLFLANAVTLLLDSNHLNLESTGKLVFNKEQSRSLILKNPKGFEKFESVRTAIRNRREAMFGRLYYDVSDREGKYLAFLERNFSAYVERPDDSHIGASLELLKTYLAFLHGAVREGKRTSKKNVVNWDTLWDEGVKKVVRFSREEDDVRSMFLTSVTLSRRIIEEAGRYGTVDIYGILYGGAELPFILERELMQAGFRGKTSIRLVTYSVYDVKNRTRGFRAEDYPNIELFDWQAGEKGGIHQFMTRVADHVRYAIGLEKTLARRKIAVVLDDNIFSGDTITGFESLVRETNKYDAVMSRVSTFMLDTRESKRMKQSAGAIRDKLPTSGNVMPVWEKDGKYENPIVSTIGRRIADETESAVIGKESGI